MKRVICIITGMLLGLVCQAQLSIEYCQEKARQNYPLVKQYGLVEQARNYDLANANRGYLPQVSLSGKVSYQSAVTELPVKIEGLGIKPLDKDQYQVLAEVNQVIWDGGTIRSAKKMTRVGAEVERGQVDVDLYAIRERVNSLFFGVLLCEEQLKQNQLMQQELQRNYDQVSAYIQNGIANQADLDAVKFEQLRVTQQETEMKATGSAYRMMLAQMIGEKVDQKMELVRPGVDRVAPSSEIVRPELSLFETRNEQLETQKSLLQAKNRPRFGVFLQGGYGNPGLNMLKNEFSAFYMAGVRLSWNFGGLYTWKNEHRQIGVNQDRLRTEEETFLFNMRLQVTQEDNEIQKIQALMKHDEEMISLRENILASVEVKVKDGTMSVLDLMREINVVDQARQAKVLHQIQWLMAVYNLKNTMGETND